MLRRLAELRPEFDPATAKCRFVICMTDASHITLLPAILAHVRRVAPGIRIEAAQIGGDTPRMLQSGEADLVLGYITDLDAGHFQQALFPQDWVCLANPKHARIRDRITARDFRREAHVLIRSGTGHQLSTRFDVVVERLMRRKLNVRFTQQGCRCRVSGPRSLGW